MHSKTIQLTNFSRAQYSKSPCLRPDTQQQLAEYLQHHSEKILARGAGFSYNDSCFNTNGLIIDTSRLNHFINFDKSTGIVVCQGNTPFKDLFLLNPEFIPPVIPGTLHATVAGGIAHDVHGKNNHLAGSFGHHIVWFDLLLNGKSIRCSKSQHSELFYATIAGLGLTGVITTVAIQLQKATRCVAVENKQFTSIAELLKNMVVYGINHDYQVAWIDLLNTQPRAIHSVATHCDPFPETIEPVQSVPKIPFSLIRQWNMKLFNRMFFTSKKASETMRLEQFNNPLDSIMHWSRLYGPKGLIQFQAVFDMERGEKTIEHLIELIKTHAATPTLAVLKVFTRSGDGLLSFCRPGFTIAIDFINNAKAREAIKAMNEFIAEQQGRVYLAKDQLLNAAQFQKMYVNQAEFAQVIKKHNSVMHSDLGLRLGILQ